jgi:hypothetical protein
MMGIIEVVTRDAEGDVNVRTMLASASVRAAAL